MTDIQEDECDERDNKLRQTIGYYTRSKRRKLNWNDEGATLTISEASDRKRKNPIMFLPPEIIRKVFSYLTHHELSQTVRLVNRKFKTAAEDILSISFKKVQEKLSVLLNTTERSLAYTKNDMEMRCILKLLNFIEVLQLQYDVIYATIWRYTFNEVYKTIKYCVYAGQLIDSFHFFMWKCVHLPHELYGNTIAKDYYLPIEVTRIIQLANLFCIHFDKINEEPVKGCLTNSGCKMIDLIDCAKFVDKQTIWEYSTTDFFSAQYCYFFKYSWFIALPNKFTNEMDEPQKQRMWHMRLRRIVLAHNEMFLTHKQYERELSLRPIAEGLLKKPENNIYTGYGDSGEIFYYYGVMNDGAYIQRFGRDEETDEEDNEGVQNEIVRNEAAFPLEENNLDENRDFLLSNLAFKLTANVACPLTYAPQNYLEKLEEQDIISLRSRRMKDETFIRLTFDCVESSYPHLPLYHQYDFKPKDF